MRENNPVRIAKVSEGASKKIKEAYSLSGKLARGEVESVEGK
jgi:hypothetical protein